ncbi:hypothetical protein BBK82_23405 [Lentzea guizhouensis]|uniref:Uncharacterized protein n=2 Tax=Lentzea guizhouensis TaxID=1586287 RepID=A0A1B2HLG7_9PSEU|nr:hypothetical protein BBK82_23405 [Lentzea guizhouensis]
MAFAVIRGEFAGSTWDAVARRFDELRWGNKDFASHQYVRDVIASVVDSGVAGRLGVTTSMHDLVVVSLETTNGHYETIKVHAPGVLAPVDDGCFVLTFYGNKRRKRGCQVVEQHPVADAVPAFWRMVGEKFGVTRDPGQPTG